MSSEDVRTLRVLLGENTHELQLPAGQRLKLHRLTYTDLAKIEDKVGSSVFEWREKNPFNRLGTMIFAIWCSLRRNPAFTMSVDDVGDMFDLRPEHADVLFKIVNEIMKLSGVEIQQPVEGKPEGNAAGPDAVKDGKEAADRPDGTISS